MCLLTNLLQNRDTPIDGTKENIWEEEMDESTVWDSTPEAVTDDHEQAVPIDPAVGVQLAPVPDQAVWPQVEIQLAPLPQPAPVLRCSQRKARPPQR